MLRAGPAVAVKVVVGWSRNDGSTGPRTFNLDGTETTGETGRGKFVRKATLSSDGKTLELVQKATFQTQDGNEMSSPRLTSSRFQPMEKC